LIEERDIKMYVCFFCIAELHYDYLVCRTLR